LAAAVLLWFIVVGPRTSEVGISVPIQYSNLPQGMEITGKWMDRIDVRVRGSEASLANLKTGSVRALVDLSQVVRGLNFFRISAKNLLVPPGIAIAHIRPSDLTLNIAAASVKKVKVSPSVIGPIPKNMRVRVSPAEVQIRAIKTELQRVKAVITDPIKASELVQKGKATVAVSVQPPGVKIEGIDPLQVTVSLERTS
jgi:diadenylate cyclase